MTSLDVGLRARARSYHCSATESFLRGAQGDNDIEQEQEDSLTSTCAPQLPESVASIQRRCCPVSSRRSRLVLNEGKGERQHLARMGVVTATRESSEGNV